jgi:hypothetical protein
VKFLARQRIFDTNEVGLTNPSRQVVFDRVKDCRLQIVDKSQVRNPKYFRAQEMFSANAPSRQRPDVLRKERRGYRKCSAWSLGIH